MHQCLILNPRVSSPVQWARHRHRAPPPCSHVSDRPQLSVCLLCWSVGYPAGSCCDHCNRECSTAQHGTARLGTARQRTAQQGWRRAWQGTAQQGYLSPPALPVAYAYVDEPAVAATAKPGNGCNKGQCVKYVYVKHLCMLGLASFTSHLIDITSLGSNKSLNTPCWEPDPLMGLVLLMPLHSLFCVSLATLAFIAVRQASQLSVQAPPFPELQAHAQEFLHSGSTVSPASVQPAVHCTFQCVLHFAMHIYAIKRSVPSVTRAVCSMYQAPDSFPLQPPQLATYRCDVQSCSCKGTQYL